MEQRKLERYKYFVPIAWFVCLGFAVFVWILVIKLNGVIQNLEISNISTEQRLKNLEDNVEQ